MTRKEVKSEVLKLTIELSLYRSSYTEEEASDALSVQLNNPQNRDLAGFILMILQATKSSSWDLGKVEITQESKA